MMDKTPNQCYAWYAASTHVFPHTDRNHSAYWLGSYFCGARYMANGDGDYRLKWRHANPYHCRVIGLLMAAEYAKCLTRNELRSCGYNT